MIHTEIAESIDALNQALAERFARLTMEAIRARGRCFVALSGGATPRGVYQLLATEPYRSRVLWDQIDVFWGDERHVPPDHADSNYGMTAETLLSKVPVSPKKIHRVHAEIPDANLAAHEYDAEIRAAFGGSENMPRFDLNLLGLGADGHTASLFPGTLALDERRQLCVANWVEKLGAYRITMTLPLINASRVIVFMVSGAEKARIVREVLQGAEAAPAARHAPPLPASLVRPVDGELWWMLDRAAAGAL
jgi:6-phosphogluconolactonase